MGSRTKALHVTRGAVEWHLISKSLSLISIQLNATVGYSGSYRSLDDEDWEGGAGAEAVPKPGGGGGGPDRALPMLKKSRVSFRVASRSPLSSSRLIDGSVSSAAFAFFTAAAAASFGVIFVLLAPQNNASHRSARAFGQR